MTMTASNPSIPGLTAEQLVAAGSLVPRLYIQAAPGSGKTAVSAHRFGLQRYTPSADQRAVVAVSFTRSATSELRTRVLQRWGPSALAWPHRIVTLDTVMYDLLTHLLRIGLIEWPGGHRELQVLDSWKVKFPTSRTCRKPALVLEGRQVVATSVSTGTEPIYTVSQDNFEKAVHAGFCTHDDLREVLEHALAADDVVKSLTSHLEATTRALIVDEIFDANTLDLAVVRLAARAGIQVTVVGDPWQALYSFRGARPEQVPVLVTEERFTQRDLCSSFRWQRNSPQDQLAAQLRSGAPTTVPIGSVDVVDIVLAREWKPLWETDARVLPLAFKSATGQVQEAASTLLLNEITRRTFGLDATYLNDALTTLGISDQDAFARLRPQLQAIMEPLAGTEDLNGIWELLNEAVATEAVDRTFPRRHATHIERLNAMRMRLQMPANHLVPGISCHQAKGREWGRVGIRLDDYDRRSLEHGLDSAIERHRTLYVALTRARNLSVAL
ncbi:UvrD-helicase domain-containing protein [Kitasatospora sp. NPDC056273]|uniref:UvrD-helicase domain-containing protein n=1 Tax=Kitasatospora sp. NPDC056273 TaxID=3345769 RepID=UPI0035E09E12